MSSKKSNTANKMLHRVNAILKHKEFEKRFSIPYYTARGLEESGAQREAKRGVSNHTTNNRYGFYSFLKFYDMAKTFHWVVGVLRFLPCGEKEDIEEVFLSHVEKMPLSDRAMWEERFELYKTVSNHIACIEAFIESSTTGLSFDSNTQEISEEFISLLTGGDSIKNVKVKKVFGELRLSEHSLDILLTDNSYIHFLLFLRRAELY